MTDIHFDGESTAYRTARDELLAAELKLIDHVEEVAVLRRNLPPARQMTNDYIFREGPADLSQNAPADMFNTPLSALFGDFDSLILIHLMYSPEAEEPCPLCSMWTDSYDAVVPHVRQHAGFALVAKAPIERVRAYAAKRGWRQMRLLSSHGTSFNRDFRVETPEGSDYPGVSVFARAEDGRVDHLYTSEAILHRERGIDLLSPVWNLLDLLPSGRGTWYPRNDYSA